MAEKAVLVVKESVDAGEKMPERTTIFHPLLDGDNGGDSNRSVDHLTAEGLVILGAASDT